MTKVNVYLQRSMLMTEHELPMDDDSMSRVNDVSIWPLELSG